MTASSVSLVLFLCAGARAAKPTTVCAAEEHCNWAGQHIVTRLWEVNDPAAYSAQRVLDVFDNGFAPAAKSKEGFRAYVGSDTLDPKHVFFWNVYESESEAAEAQKAAAEFKASGELSDKITPDCFCGGTIAFQVMSDSFCVAAPDVQAMYISIRHYVALDGYTTQQIVDTIFPDGFMLNDDGFQMSLAALTVATGEGVMPKGTPMVVLLTIFETLEQATYFNQQAAQWDASLLAGKAKLCLALPSSARIGRINFGHFCRGVIPVCPAPSAPCSGWCNFYTCGMQACQGCTVCAA